MIQQLVARIAGLNPPPGVLESARLRVLTADPLDLVLHMEQVWQAYSAPPAPNLARQQLIAMGGFVAFPPQPVPIGAPQAWDHLGYAYVLENTRAAQIIRRVVHAFRAGEGLGIPSPATQRWLDATEALLFGATNPFAAWLSTSAVRPDPEAGRRGAYWRLLGLDLAFGDDQNRPPVYDKAAAANANFVGLLEELLYELWQAMANLHNFSGADASDDDRIFRIAEALMLVLRARRQQDMLAREELAAATALGWIELTLSMNSPVVADAGADATNPGNRLANLGAKVGLAAHSKSSALFSMAAELSILLRAIEAGVVTGPGTAWLLYRSEPLPAAPPDTKTFGGEARRVITEWGAATGKDLKARAKPVDTHRRRLVSAG